MPRNDGYLRSARPLAVRVLRRGPRTNIRRSLGSLGDDSLEGGTLEWQDKVLAELRAQTVAHATWADGDKFQKWVAIGATCMIPVFAALWKKFGVGRWT